MASAVSLASSFTSLATTAKPLPASPARAASMVALRASRFVCSAMEVMTFTTSPISAELAPSWTTVPHFFVAREVDASALNAARARLLPVIEASHQVRVTHTDLLAALVAKALVRHPRLNASWTGGAITLHDTVNIALAMAVEGAVVTAVVQHAEHTEPGAIAMRRRELAERVKSNRLQPADIAGATFTISNLGMFDVDAFTAIIVPPQAAIVGSALVVASPIIPRSRAIIA